MRRDISLSIDDADLPRFSFGIICQQNLQGLFRRIAIPHQRQPIWSNADAGECLCGDCPGSGFCPAYNRTNRKKFAGNSDAPRFFIRVKSYN